MNRAQFGQNRTNSGLNLGQSVRNSTNASRQSRPRISVASGLALASLARYIRPVASKKGAIGIGLPLNPLRRKPQSPQLVCGFFVRAPFWRLDEQAQAWPVRASGFPVDQLVELPPSIGLEAAVFANRTCLEAIHG